MATTKIKQTIKTPALTFTETRQRTGTNLLTVTKTVPRSIAGVLALRPTTQTGTVVVNTESHGLTVSDLVDLYFENGTVCLNAGVASVTEEVLGLDTSNAVQSFDVIPNTVGASVIVAPHTEFALEVADVADMTVLAYELRHSRSSVSLFSTARMILSDGGDPIYTAFLMTPPNGVIWDVDSLNSDEADLASALGSLLNIASGTISNPSADYNATFRLTALLNVA